MRSFASASLRAALAGALVLTAVGAASARDGRNGALIGGAAAGVIGGMALGAILNNGAQPAPPPPPRARPVYVEEEPVYAAPPPPRGPVCHFERRKQWLNDVEFTYKRVEVCE